jgi:DNA-binding transcriptional regulator YhcF (GntR family)
MLEIDVSSPEPVFEQIVAQIGLAIINKGLTPGDKLPPIRQLASDLEINPNTVARAYQILEENGMLETKGRAGSLVTASAREAYEVWLVSIAKSQITSAWKKILALGPNHEMTKRVWKLALKELKND